MSESLPIIRPREEHTISRRNIDPDALKVLYRLARQGHTAYLVGGGVRDLLLGLAPKDFDVSTNANPAQIKKLFRNCFLIGRRFRLAHIKFGENIIETSTFRATPEHDDSEGDLLQRDDNIFGTPASDAARRDFTINGLFYDAENFSVIDYVGGLTDLNNRQIRSIGDPAVRFQEDPVRMLRAVRFAGRLGFAIEEKTYAAICKYAPEIKRASPARLLEDIYKLFGFSAAAPTFKLLYKTGLLQEILPVLDTYLRAQSKPLEAPLWRYLAALDHGDLVVSDASNALCLATLFYPVARAAANKPDSSTTQRLLITNLEELTKGFFQRHKAPRRLRDRLTRIFTTQHRFMSTGKKNFNKSRFVAQDWFPEALALYEIHLTATKKDFSRAQEWRDLLLDLTHAAENGKTAENSVVAEDEEQPSKNKRRRRRGGRRHRQKNSAATGENTNDAGAKKRYHKSRPQADKQILPDHRPSTVKETFDNTAQAPHWSDEV